MRRVVVTALFVTAILGGALLGVFLAVESDLPQVTSLEDFKPNIITQVFAADGSVLGEFAIEKRVVIAFRDIPPVLRNAIVAVEDDGFWKHIGINPWRIPGAALANLRSGRASQGFSTLTMQLSRILFLTPEKTYERKIKEIILAFQIEKNFTKEEIFTLYCNQMYFGHGNYGVEAASRFYFGKPVKDLTLSEAALIAGILQRPHSRTPIVDPEGAVARRNLVLDRMAEEKYITREEAEEARREPLELHLRREPPSVAPYFLEEVRKYLEREYGSQRIYQGGPARVHHARPADAAGGGARAARRAAASRPPGAGLPEADRDRCSWTGSSPIPCTSPSGTGPSPRGTWSAAWWWPRTAPRPWCRSATTAATVGPRDVGWTQAGPGRRRAAPGHGGPLPHRVAGGGRTSAARRRAATGAGAGGGGRAAGPRRRRRERCGPWSAGTTSSAASSTAPPRPGDRSAPPSSPSSTRRPSRPWAGRPRRPWWTSR